MTKSCLIIFTSMRWRHFDYIYSTLNTTSSELSMSCGNDCQMKQREPLAPSSLPVTLITFWPISYDFPRIFLTT